MIWTLHDITAATNGTCNNPAGNLTIGGIAIDHRKTLSNDLFVALKGDNHDGHDYVAAAHQAGAVAGLVERPVDSTIPQIEVKDSLVALGDLGRAARRRTKARITAITGSVGKTGTRHLVATCLSAQGLTHASEGNYNNHIGAPMSLALMPQDSKFGVFELGMNHAGEIARLSPMVRPDVAIITRITDSHLGHFDHLDDIAKAKGEIFCGLTEGGVAILNADDPYTPMLSKMAREQGAAKVITCGHGAGADVRIEALHRHDQGLSIKANINGTRQEFDLKMMAPHWALSAVMGLATVQYFGGDLNASAQALSQAPDLDGRGARHHLTLKDGRRITLIDDSYNASPASMTAALLSLKDDPNKGRRVAILGDMLELGTEAESLHEGLISAVDSGGIQILITFGKDMAFLAQAAQSRPNLTSHHGDDMTAATAIAMETLSDGDVVLIKGSNGMKTSHITTALIDNSSPKGDL